MNLTNQYDHGPMELSSSLSNYILSQQPIQDYNYSDSNINQTLLLQATLNQSQKPKEQLRTLKSLRQDSPSLNRQKSLLFDLCCELSMNQSKVRSNEQTKSQQKIDDLYNICRNLIQTISKLQNKVDKMQQKESRKKDYDSDYSNTFQQKDVQSVLTYSSLQNSKGSKHDSQNQPQKDLIYELLEVLNSSSKIQTVKDENQSLRQQIIRLQIQNQELRKTSKKNQTQNTRLRQLLKQYQGFNKRLIEQKTIQTKQTIQRNYSHKLLSQRKGLNSKINTGCFEDYKKQEKKRLPMEYYNFDQKQNIKQIQKDKFIEHKKKICTHPASPIKNISHHLKDHTKIDTDIKINSLGHHQHLQYYHNNIISFEQLKPFDLCHNSSPYSRPIDTVKNHTELQSKTFRDLKKQKTKGSKKSNY